MAVPSSTDLASTDLVETWDRPPLAAFLYSPPPMVAASITCLLILAGYLAKRWNESNNEVMILRSQVSTLKKRLAQR